MAKIYDLIIIGAGPAGVTAAIYGSRENLKILLIAKNIGGQIKRKAIKIENYPGFKEISGRDLIQKFEDHLKKFKISVIIDKVNEVKKKKQTFFVSTKKKKQFSSRSVIIASGADARLLGIPGEKELIGKGVSYCAICDGFLYKNKTTAVIGGGNTGFETAIFLSELAKKVYILEHSPEVKADKINQKIVKMSRKIKIITNAVLLKIKGENFVESIEYKDNISKETKILKIDGVFVEIGNIPSADFVNGLVDFNKRNEIKIDSKTGETKTKGLFAAGDITDIKFKQIITAAGQGAIAGLSASKYYYKGRKL